MLLLIKFNRSGCPEDSGKMSRCPRPTGTLEEGDDEMIEEGSVLVLARTDLEQSWQ